MGTMKAGESVEREGKKDVRGNKGVCLCGVEQCMGGSAAYGRQ